MRGRNSLIDCPTIAIAAFVVLGSSVVTYARTEDVSLGHVLEKPRDIKDSMLHLRTELGTKYSAIREHKPYRHGAV